jgi:hypothetical protein
MTDQLDAADPACRACRRTCGRCCTAGPESVDPSDHLFEPSWGGERRSPSSSPPIAPQPARRRVRSRPDRPPAGARRPRSRIAAARRSSTGSSSWPTIADGRPGRAAGALAGEDGPPVAYLVLTSCPRRLADPRRAALPAPPRAPATSPPAIRTTPCRRSPARASPPRRGRGLRHRGDDGAVRTARTCRGSGATVASDRGRATGPVGRWGSRGLSVSIAGTGGSGR